jgi:hypothetical protein
MKKDMEKTIDILDQFDMESRINGLTLEDYLEWLEQLRDDLDMKIEAVKGDIKRKKK